MPGTQHLARNTLLFAVLELAERHGVRREAILNEIGLDPATAAAPGAFVKSSQLIDAVEFAAIATGRDDFGLELAGLRDLMLLGPIGVLVEQCSSVVEAVNEAVPYMHLHNTALHYTLSRADGAYVFRLELKARGKYEPRHYVETLLCHCVRLCRLWLGETWVPAAVSLEHARLGRPNAYTRMLGRGISFGQPISAIFAPKADLERKIPRADPRIKQLVRRLLDDLDQAHATQLAPKVAALLRLLIPSGRATAAEVAKLLSMTARTFQRRLADQGTTFSRELAAARLQLARDYLPRDVTLTELAPIVGLSEASAVSRFLKTQTGNSARGLRQPPARKARY